MNDPKKRAFRLWVCAVLSLPLGDLWVRWILGGCDGWRPMAFSVCFFLFASFALSGKKPKTKEHLFWCVCSFSIAVAIAADRKVAVSAFGYLALHGFAGYWVLCRTGLLTAGESSRFLCADLFDVFLRKPFSPLGFSQLSRLRVVCLFRLPFQRLRGVWRDPEGSKVRRKTALVVLLCVLAVIPLFLHVGNLLSQADDSFGALWDSIGRLFTIRITLSEFFAEELIYFLFGLPVGAYLFSMITGCLCEDAPTLDPENALRLQARLRVLSVICVSCILLSFIGLYLLFFGVQARVLLGAFFETVPGKLTVSDYARQGFFQLTKVMGINFLLIAAAELLCNFSLREQRVLRFSGSILMAESLLLAITAASKLILYFQRFGVTVLRAVSLWGILVMAAGSILAAIRIWKAFPAAKIWIFFSAASFTVFCFLF